MAVPSYVPNPVRQIKHYRSAKKIRHESGVFRPAEILVNQSERAGTGNPGPDQGFALRLVKAFKGLVSLSPKEKWADASEVAVITALKRASLYGRAPCHYDLEVGFRVWGYLDPDPDSDLIDLRINYFPHIGSGHNYLKRRKVADALSSAKLRQPLEVIRQSYESDWRILINPTGLQES